MIYTNTYHFDTYLMPELDEKLIFFVSLENGIGMEKLFRKTGIGNRNKFYDLVDSMEERNIIHTEKNGRTRTVYLKSIDKKVNHFLNTFGKRLDQYEKEINKNLALLEKNLPLISETRPMKPVKIKIPKLELIKKTKSEWKYKAQGTINDHGMTWNPRAKPKKYFDTVLQLLHKLYQESSVLTFGDTFTDDTKLIKEFQNRSEKLIKDTSKKIEDMFRGKADFVFAVTQLRQSIYALIYKLTLKEDITKLEKLDSPVL